MLSALGYDQTTLADIRRKAGASTGSIYHHFGSKEQIAASLYLDGIRQTQEAGLTALLRTRTARTGVAAQVGAYIDWVVAHPDLATFLFAMRRAPFLDNDEPTIAALNDDIRERSAAMDRRPGGGRRAARPRTATCDGRSCSGRAGTGPDRGYGGHEHLTRECETADLHRRLCRAPSADLIRVDSRK